MLQILLYHSMSVCLRFFGSLLYCFSSQSLPHHTTPLLLLYLAHGYMSSKLPAYSGEMAAAGLAMIDANYTLPATPPLMTLWCETWCICFQHKQNCFYRHEFFHYNCTCSICNGLIAITDLIFSWFIFWNALNLRCMERGAMYMLTLEDGWHHISLSKNWTCDHLHASLIFYHCLLWIQMGWNYCSRT